MILPRLLREIPVMHWMVDGHTSAPYHTAPDLDRNRDDLAHIVH